MNIAESIDINGCVVTTSAGATTLAYDYESRVTGITYPGSSTNSFTYNGLDTRVSKVDSSGTKTYRRDGAYVTDPVLSDGSLTYTPGISTRSGSTSKFQHADRLGSNARQTNSSESAVSTQRWDAFGMPVSSSGTHSGPFGFAGAWGYQQDAGSGLMLLGHRYYDASTGKGSWHHKGTGGSLRHDFDHPPPVGPHWDYGFRGPKDRWRILPDGRILPKQ